MSSHNKLRSMITSIVRGTQETPSAASAAAAAAAETQQVLDGVKTPEQEAAEKEAADKAAAEAAAAAEANKGAVFDDASDPGNAYADSDVSLKAVAAVQAWAETDDLGEGEGYADRLLALLVGIADADMDGEISDVEADVVEMAANAAWDYMSDKGVSDEDLSELFNEWDNDVASRVHELIVSKLPDGEEASADDMDSFVFGDGSDEAALDSAVLDATYKKKIVVRKGKKVRINKRVAGTVRLSAKQKLAVRKMLRKSHGAMATMRRAKSVRVRKQLGL